MPPVKRKEKPKSNDCNKIFQAIESIEQEIKCPICYCTSKFMIELDCDGSHLICGKCFISLVTKNIRILESTYIPEVDFKKIVSEYYEKKMVSTQILILCPLCRDDVAVFETHLSSNNFYGFSIPGKDYEKNLELLKLLHGGEESKEKEKEDEVQNMCLCKPNSHKNFLQIMQCKTFRFQCPFSGTYVPKNAECHLDDCFIEGEFPKTKKDFLKKLSTHLEECQGLILCDFCARVVKVRTLKTHLIKHKSIKMISKDLEIMSSLFCQPLLENGLLRHQNLLQQMINCMKVLMTTAQCKEHELDENVQEKVEIFCDLMGKQGLLNRIGTCFQLNGGTLKSTDEIENFLKISKECVMKKNMEQMHQSGKKESKFDHDLNEDQIDIINPESHEIHNNREDDDDDDEIEVEDNFNSGSDYEDEEGIHQ